MATTIRSKPPESIRPGKIDGGAADHCRQYLMTNVAETLRLVVLTRSVREYENRDEEDFFRSTWYCPMALPTILAVTVNSGRAQSKSGTKQKLGFRIWNGRNAARSEQQKRGAIYLTSQNNLTPAGVYG
ncbi:hypothetical protein [Sphingopyxis granuli]|uniref:hypothetical protein n=1 Tax=Sphingopyxis granuli TaxID=267128 RepID=UPI0012E87C24|nr:hypothetical protein [Sphingopyxis granuli]